MRYRVQPKQPPIKIDKAGSVSQPATPMPETSLPDFQKIPADPSAQQMRVASLVTMQQQRGNAFVQRELSKKVQAGSEAAIVSPAAAVPVSQSTTAPTVQRGFWDTIASGFRAIGRGISSAFSWLGNAIGEAANAVFQTIRRLPERLVRLGETIVEGLRGVVTFIPEAIQALAQGGTEGFADWLWERARSGGTWLLTLLSRVFDVLGGPELLQFLIRIASHATPLTSTEIAAADRVFGSGAIDYSNVRIAQGPLLDLIFRLNGGRAFTTWDTINMPSSGDHGRNNLSIVIHELTHVRQYQAVGTVYLGQAIHAQMTIGYGYGGAAGLQADRATGKRYSGYNREQQGQIAQDYHTLSSTGSDVSAYEPFINDLRAGIL